MRRIKDEHRRQTKSLLDHALRDAEAAHDEQRVHTVRAQLAELIKESKRARR